MEATGERRDGGKKGSGNVSVAELPQAKIRY